MLTKARFTSNHLYPTSDGKPMAETDRHCQLMFDLIEQLKRHFAGQTDTYVSGNLLLYYDPKDKRRHLSPDCMVIFGVPNEERINYLTWEEGKGPDVVFELTSSSTRHEDTTRKFERYRDVLRVREYFLFDPYEDYLDPAMQGYRLRGGQYVNIQPKAGRLPSQLLGLHLERDGSSLRLWNPATGERLLTIDEREAAAAEREAALQAELARLRARLEPKASGNGAHP